MEDFLYAYNQPKKFGKYDLILDGKIIADEVVTKSGSIGGGGEDTSNCVKINEPITITEGDNTTSITSDTISTTTLTGTLDAESMKNSLTAEAIQKVVPIVWEGNKTTTNYGTSGFVVGQNSRSGYHSVVLGDGCNNGNNSVVVGKNSIAKGTNNQVILGWGCQGTGLNSVLIGHNGGDCTIKSNANTSITIGAAFKETTDNGNVAHTCTTEGTGSITIGAGANTKNTTKTVDGVETTVESSNSITIGCKAENYNPDSIVIGASAKLNAPEAYGSRSGSIVIGAEAQSKSVNGIAIGRRANTYYALDGIAIGTGARANANTVAIGSNTDAGMGSLALGYYTKATAYTCVAIGSQVDAKAKTSSAFGIKAVAADEGVCVFSSFIVNGNKTQLYFSGADTPLALKYYPTEWEKKQDVDEEGNPKVDDEGNPIMIDDKDKPTKGQAMMGYVVSKVITNDEGKQETKVVECGTNLLAALFPNHGLGDNPFQPTTTAIDGEIVSFHPSDLDLPIEETPIEEEYKPLPIYPIVEPTIDEITE